MDKDTKNNLKVFGVIILGILSIAVVIYFVPSTINDIECFEDIAKSVCGDLNYSLNNKILDNTYLYFTCCNYSKVDNTRLLFNKYPICTEYYFLESDIKNCSNKFYHWRLYD